MRTAHNTTEQYTQLTRRHKGGDGIEHFDFGRSQRAKEQHDIVLDVDSSAFIQLHTFRRSDDTHASHTKRRTTHRCVCVAVLYLVCWNWLQRVDSSTRLAVQSGGDETQFEMARRVVETSAQQRR